MVAGDGIDRRGGKNTGLPRIIATNYEERKAQIRAYSRARYARNREERKAQMRAYSRARYARNRAQGLTAKGTARILHLNPAWRKERTRRNREWVREEMLRRGRCAYHMEYWGHELPVDLAVIECFEWDHIDRSIKKGRDESQISRLVARNELEDVQAEIARCALVCSNCHQIKTQRNRDWTPVARVTEIEHLHLQLNLPI